MASALNRWTSLGNGRKAIVLAASLLAFLAVFALGRMAVQPNLSLLYSGLEPSAAGEVLTALEAGGVTYEVRGGSIFVDSAARDGLRMSLASQGLPSTASQGYELLDTLTGFGTTSQMFDAAYWRAKEGELARTIASTPAIKSARVHISAKRRSPLSRNGSPSASVSITTMSMALPAGQVQALRHLVASAVPDLSADDVAVIDSERGLITDAGSPDMAGQSGQAEVLRANVLRLLEARVGPGKAIVEVSLEHVLEHETITERIIDPDSRVAISQNTEERSNRAQNAQNGAVTVASNLPDGAGGGSGQNSESNDSETRQVTNYDVSETRRDITREPGAIRRLSVAVLVDGEITTADDGTSSWQPRSEAELADLQDLVATAVGLSPERGDSLTLKTLQFNEPPSFGATPASPPMLAALDPMKVLQIGTLAVVALLLGLFVVRPILLRAPPPRLNSQSALESPGAAQITQQSQVLEKVQEGNQSTRGLRENSAEAIEVIDPSTDKSSPATRLRRLMSDRESETVKVLSDWMNDDGRVKR